MADYTSITIEWNGGTGGTGTDATPVWTGTAIAFGGTSGANELRFIDTGAGGAGNIASASWPYTTRPSSGTAAVRELYAYQSDSSGYKVTTYNGDKTYARVLRLNHDNTGTYASAPRWSAFADNTHPTPSKGTQADSPTNGANIINGASPDTGAAASETSYLKGNGYGSGLTAGGTQETPSAGNAGTTLAVTSGTAGSVSPSAGAWLATWQSLQGWTQYITLPAIPQATTAFYYYFTLALFMGISMKPGVMPFCPIVFDYTYS